MSTNGRLPAGDLAEIPRATNGDRCYLRRDAAAAFNAMNAESVRRYGVTLRTSSGRTAYRTLAQQHYFWDLHQRGQGALAARPGTSNHGLGLAVDLATPQMWAIVNRIGAKYGWQKRWSDAPTEPWHFKWKAARYPAVTAARDPLAGYQRDEIRWIRAYDRKPPAKTRRALQRRMTRRIDEIERAAKKTGWTKARRTARHRSLTARTKEPA